MFSPSPRRSNMLLGAVTFVIVALMLAGIYALGAVFIAWAFNCIVPLFWHAAPHLTWVHGIAIEILSTIVRGLVTVNQKVEKK
jgi:hypothetical protein